MPIDRFEATCLRNRKLTLDWQRSNGSREWASEVPQGRTDSLARLLAVARSIARNQGVPPSCVVSFESCRETESAGDAAGCAGFFDAPVSFERPFIRLDPEIASRVDSDQVLDVYCGIALHEAGHILYSKELYARRLNSRYGRVFLNLWEDERIESLLRRDSPGYRCYIEALRQFMIRQLKPAVSDWNRLPDLNRLLLLIHCFIRCPEIITAEMRRWQPIPRCDPPFVQLSRSFVRDPSTAADSLRFSRRTKQLWEGLRRLYPRSPSVYVRWRAEGRLDGRNAPAVVTQLEEDAIERARRTESSSFRSSRFGSSARKQLIRSVRKFYRAADDAGGADATRLRQAGDRLAALADRRHWPTRHPFGLHGTEDLRAGGTTGGGDTAVERARRSERKGSSTSGPEVPDAQFRRSWSWNGTEQRQTLIEFAQPTADSRERVARARSVVVGHTAVLRAALRTLFSGEREWLCDRRRGVLDRSRLWRAAFDERLFRQSDSGPDGGVSLGLLIDESGSMFHRVLGGHRRIDLALEATVMMVDAVHDIDDVELEVYSHCSDGETNRNCLLRYLYGRDNRRIDAIGTWAPGIMNYDHEAVTVAAQLLRQNTSHENRWLIVVSDGSPEGEGYQGEAAIEATRRAVRSVRLDGIRVLCVAIADYCADEIFGEPFVLKFTDVERFAHQMRALVMQIVRP